MGQDRHGTQYPRTPRNDIQVMTERRKIIHEWNNSRRAGNSK
ncbi:hypothetical protein E2C01_049040 [Portunus trituberculatus]|uniref:Uncharacterized protein n=1 Tax=Portunus trituberculatus TaxID=210409 RepID=A0A5B7GC40_PORTR|nr:hypothetical protein [Portunus trituberculatus]